VNPFLLTDAAWRQLFSATKGYAFVLLDETGNVATWNEGARAMKLYEASEIIGKHFSQLYTPESRAVGHPQHELAIAASVGRYEEEGWRVRKDGSRFWAHVVIIALFDGTNALCGFGKIVQDMTEEKRTREQHTILVKLLEQTALTDHLTGLDNRRSLDSRLAAAIASERRGGRGLCLAILDLDRFKTYNDEFGHQAGDTYLRQAADRWREAVRAEDVIARYGGEEFAVVMPGSRLDGAVICMERLRAATPAQLTCSIGLAEWKTDELPDGLLGRADRAMFRAKSSGRDRIVLAPACRRRTTGSASSPSDKRTAPAPAATHVPSRSRYRPRPAPRHLDQHDASPPPAE
jgi:diguanylate cyclase (GGDEF)-like protein/PAS domain S-box-containing protein